MKKMMKTFWKRLKMEALKNQKIKNLAKINLNLWDQKDHL